ncbi:MAG: transcriptional repressor [Candidatus Peribacteria bacterium]|nr:MAG: transcriptional repressor [Candidatus Peribacteria bacterium]
MKTHFYCEDIVDICDKHHLTADEIFERLSKTCKDVGISSVYRNVEELVKKGKLRKVTGLGKKAYFEKNHGDHIHLIDIETGKIFDYDCECVQGMKLPGNFQAESMDMKIYGKFS